MALKETYQIDSAQGQRALGALRKEMDGYDKSTERAGKRLSAAEKEARRLNEQADPTLRYARNMHKLAGHVKEGRVALGAAEKIALKYQQRLEGTAAAGQRAYGSKVLGDLRGVAAQWASVGAAVGLATQGVRSYIEEQSKAQEAAKEASAGAGSLAQLAVTGGATPAARKAEQRRLEREAARVFASGAARTLQEAEDLTFSLNSAGLSKSDRDFLVEARANNLINDPGKFASAIAAFTSGYSISVEDLTSKSLAVSRVAPAQANEIVQEAAKIGAGAASAGIGEDFLLAATALLAKTYGSASEGATRVKGLVTGLRKVGFQKDPTLQGKSGVDLLKALRAKGAHTDFATASGLLGGRQEGIDGATVLINNLPLLEQLIGEASVADDSRLASEAIGLANLNPVFSAARAATASKNRRELERLSQSELPNLIQAARDDLVTNRRQNYSAPYAELLNAYEGFALLGNSIEGPGRQVELLRQAAATGQLTDDTQTRILETLERIAIATEAQGGD